MFRYLRYLSIAWLYFVLWWAVYKFTMLCIKYPPHKGDIIFLVYGLITAIAINIEFWTRRKQ
jgi:hypothetical protein